MALQAVVYQQDLFDNNGNDLQALIETWTSDFTFPNEHQQQQQQQQQEDDGDDDFSYNYTEIQAHNDSNYDGSSGSNGAVNMVPKRQRGRGSRAKKKNEEEKESQRMTHIAVERNRRKQMNDYLSVLRSSMPDSYVQRGDQASIVGGAINYIKQLQHTVQYLTQFSKPHHSTTAPFSESFGFPQYSSLLLQDGDFQGDIEVTITDAHAQLMIRCQRQPRLLVKIVSELQQLSLTVLHLNVVTATDVTLYTFSLKVEEESYLSSADEIATAVYHILSSL